MTDEMTTRQGPLERGVRQTCGGCRYRGEEITKNDEDSDWEDVGTGFFQCQRFKLVTWDNSIKAGDGARVKDGSQYHGVLCVESDFACVKWEA